MSKEGGTAGREVPLEIMLRGQSSLGSLRQGEIGARLDETVGNITLVVDNLAKASLVHRERLAFT